MQTTATTTAAVSTDALAKSTNVAGIDLALLVDQLTRTGSSPEMTATILSTLVATSPDAGPEEQKQILQKLTEALRERQRQIELQKLAAINGTGAVSSSTPVSQCTITVSTIQPQVSSLSSAVVTGSSVPVLTTAKELTTRPIEPIFPNAASSVTAPAVSTTSFVSVLPTSAGIPSIQQWVSSVSCPSTVTFSSSNISALPVSLATTSTAIIHPPATSALPPAVQQMLSGQSFENLKNILANVTSRKTGGIGIQDQGNVSSTSSMVRTLETLDSYTTSKDSRSDLHKMATESEVQSKKSSEQDELFVANIHGDVDYRVRPPVPSDPPKTTQPFSVSQSGWIGGGDQFPLPGSLTLQQPEGQYVGAGGTRSLLPGPFPQNLSHQSKSSSGGPLLAVPPRTGKPQALLPTPESSKPAGQQREERGRENREGRKQKSEDAETNRDRPRYKDRRPFDNRSSSRDDSRRKRSSRERSDIDQISERRDGSQSTDRSVSQKPTSSSRGSEERSGMQVPRSEEGPIIIDDDCADIPLPPTTAASKSTDTSLPLAETLTSKKQHFDADRKVLLPTPDKEVSVGEKRKSDESQRQQKFSRSWEHRRSLKSSPKGTSGTKVKKALLETPVASGSSESGRVSDSAGTKDSRTVKHDSDSKSYDRRRSRSKSRTRNIASNLVDRSRRKLGLQRHRRSSSRDRRHTSSRTAAHDTRRRSRSRERPATRSKSRDRLEEEEQRLRKQLDDLMARKNEENRSKDRQFSPSYSQDQRHEQSSEMPSLFDVMQNPDAHANAGRPLPRRHLLPAPHLISANLPIKGRALLEPPVVPMPGLAESGIMRHNVDRNRVTHYGQSADQPLLPSTAMLPGQPFVQEYSHKPAETHTDQFRYGQVTDHINSHKDSASGRPTFREELGQHRYRPYPVPEGRHRVPPESTERGRNWQVRGQLNKEMDTSAGIEKVGLPEASISEHSSPAFTPMDQHSTMCQSAENAPSAKPEMPLPGQGLLPLSSATGTFSTAGTLVDKPAEQTLDVTVTSGNEDAFGVQNIPCPRPPIFPDPPFFPAFLPNVRNLPFPRGPSRVPFLPIPGPFPPGAFRLPLPSFPMPPISAPVARQDSTPTIMSMNRASAPVAGQSRETAAPSKKPLLGDYPGNKPPPPLMAEVTAIVNAIKNTGPESVQQQSEEERDSKEQVQVHDEDDSASRLMAPPRLLEMESNQTQNTPNSQLPLDTATGEETGEDLLQAEDSTEQDESSGAVPSLLDFMGGPLAQGHIPPQFGPPLIRGPPPHVRGRMPFPERFMRHGMRVPRPMSPALRGLMELPGGPAAFPRRGGPSFPPRGAPRYPQ